MSDSFGVGTDDALKAVMDGDNVFVTGPGGCVDADTEYLSTSGWRKIKDYNGEMLLVVDENMEAWFEKPALYHDLPCEEMFSFQGRNMDMLLSEEHRVILQNRGRKYKGKKYKDTLVETSAKELAGRFVKSKKGLSCKLLTTFDYSGQGVEMSEGELRLQVAVMADGRIVKGGKDNYCQMRFSKKRKYDRLLWLCQTFSLPYKDNGGRLNSKYSSGLEYEIIVWPKTDEKHFTERYYQCSKEQLETIVDEVVHWDGSVSVNCLVNSNSKEDADFVQFAAAATGVRSTIRLDARGKNANYEVRKTRCKLVSFPKGTKGKISLETVRPQGGRKYCFTVGTGMWVMRRNGKVVITGNTGKTHTIKKIQALYPDTTLTVAPTGVAALNVDGMTAHRAFGLSMGVSTDDDVSNVKKRHEKLMKSRDLERIIIDEVSMIRADKLWEIDQKLQLVRKVKKPFGGLQMVMFGDFYQNLPVLTSSEEDLYRGLHNTELACWSDTWRNAQMYPVLLEKMYRQQSDNFARMLNCLRKGERLDDVVQYINDNCYKPLNNPSAITLTSTNAAAERINKKFFDDIKSPAKVYTAKVEGDFKSKPGPDELSLKEGLKVMITANQVTKPHEDPAYVNGSIGFIKKLFSTYVVVELLDGAVVDVMTNVWENVEYTPEKYIDPATGKQKSKIAKKVIGQFSALPLRPAYAVTIHKAQGLTLPAVNIDFGYGTFSPGMAYVALSRATHTGGLRMIKPLKKRDILVDPRVIQFYNQTFPGK